MSGAQTAHVSCRSLILKVRGLFKFIKSSKFEPYSRDYRIIELLMMGLLFSQSLGMSLNLICL